MGKRHHIIPFLLAITAILPVMPSSCSRIEYSPASPSTACSYLLISTMAGDNSFSINVSGAAQESIDLFVYNDDELGRLDCCQRIIPSREGNVTIGSTSGRKKVVAIANLPEDFFAYEDILSFEGLSEVYMDIADENPGFPVMSGMTRVTAGPSGTNVLQMVPLLCRVDVRHVTVDFSDRSYKDKKLENIRCYLTNVSGLCPVFPSEEIYPNEILNNGALSIPDCERMSHPEMIRSDTGEGSVLYCYPRTDLSGNLPRTKLVVEGCIDGTKYYYPIVIASEKGMRPGVNYVLDLIITRTGLTNPDGTIGSGPVEGETIVANWNEHDNTNIEF